MAFEPNQGQVDPEVRFIARGRGYQVFLTPAEVVLAMAQSAGTDPAFPLAHKAAPPTPGALGCPGDDPPVLRLRFPGANPSARGHALAELPGKVNYLLGNDPGQWRKNVRTFERVQFDEIYPGIDVVFYGNQRQLEFDFVLRPGADPDQIRIEFEGADAVELEASGDLVARIGDREIRQHKPVIYQIMNGERRIIGGAYTWSSERGRPRPQQGVQPSQLHSIEQGANERLLGRLDRDQLAQHAGSSRRSAVAAPGDGRTPEDSASGANPRAAVAAEHAPLPRVAFQLAAYDRSLPLVIDPVITYATLLGGDQDDQIFAIAADAAGNAFLTGYSRSLNFPVPGGGPPRVSLGGVETFVAKLSPSGTLLFTTFVGGNSDETGEGIALDATGNIYVCGSTHSDHLTFPQVNPFQLERRGGAEGFVFKLEADGSDLVYSSFIGGDEHDQPSEIALDANHNAYITGYTRSANFPTVNPIQASNKGFGPHGFGDVFISKVNAAGSAIVYSTYLGGGFDEWAHSIAVDGAGNAYVHGWTTSKDFPTANAFQSGHGGGNIDLFVAKLNAVGTALVYSTYLGGSEDEYGQIVGRRQANCIAVRPDGTAYVVAGTGSLDFPWHNTTSRYRGAVLVKLGAGGVVESAAGLGGGNLVYGMALSASGLISYVAQAVPGLVNPTQAAPGGDEDFAVVKLDPDGPQILLSTYFGGSWYEEAVGGITFDGAGNVLFAGIIQERGQPFGFPAVNAAQSAYAGGGTDGFVAKISDPDLRPPVIVNVTTRGNPNGVYVEFSETVDEASAVTIANYALTPSVPVTAATVILNSRTVRLTTGSPLAAGTTYSLTVNQVKDRALPAGNSIAPNTKAAFTTTPFLPEFSGQTLSGYQDDFNGTELASAWVPVGSDKTVYSVAEGVLRVRSAAGDPNHLLYQAPGYNNTIQEVLARIRFSNFGTGDGARGGIGVAINSNDFDGSGPGYFFRDEGPLGRHTEFLDNRHAWGPEHDLEWSNGTWYWIRLRHDPFPEPSLIPENPFAFFIEAEDFNFDGGQHIKNQPIGMDGPYTGGAYQGLGGVQGIDFNDTPGNDANPPHYRPSTPVEAARPGVDGFARGSFNVTVNHTIGWTPVGEWYNYTRNFPAGEYYVYARLASGGSPESAQLDEVTSGATTATQTLKRLGQFNSPASGGWETYHFVPLREDSGTLAKVSLSGERTLRFTILPGNLDFNYLAFVPVAKGPLDLDALPGADVYAKVWRADGSESEPTTWQTWDRYPGDSVHSGYAGITASTAGGVADFEVDYFLLKASGLPSITVAPAGAASAFGPIQILQPPPAHTVAELAHVQFRLGADSLKGSGPYSYQWLKNGVLIPGATSAEHSIPSVKLADAGSYSVQVANDFSSATSATATLAVTPDTTAPTIVSAIGYADQITINFSEPVSEATAANPANYTFSGGLKLASTPVANPAASLSHTRNLQLWLKADAGVTINENGKVLSWLDASGQGNHAAQAVETSAPDIVPAASGGKPALHFDGNDDFLEVPYSPTLANTGDVTSFVVVQLDDYSVPHTLWSQNTVWADPRSGGMTFLLDQGTFGLPVVYRGNSSTAEAIFADVQAPLGRFAILGFTVRGPTVTFSLNGQTIGVRQSDGDFHLTPTNPGHALRLGADIARNTRLKGSLAEVLIYDTALLDAELDAVVAYLRNKYSLIDPVTPASLSVGGRSVVLKTTPQTEGVTYTVTVSNVRDTSAASNVITPGAQTSFTSQSFLTGHLLREQFFPAGVQLHQLDTLARFPDRPNVTDFVAELSATDRLQLNHRDNYVTRLRGLLTPPFTGEYTFYMVSDDQAAFYLSPDGDPANKQLAAFASCCAGERQWGNAIPGIAGEAGSRSTPIFLRAGQKYAIEVLHTEFGSDEYAQVNWRLPGGEPAYHPELPIPAAYLAFAAPTAGASLAITQQPQGAVLQENQRTTLSVQATASSPTILYQWQRNGANIPGATQSTYTTPFLKLADNSVKYRCVVSIVGAQVISAEALINVVNDTSGPVLLSATADSRFRAVKLQFSEPLNPADAVTAANYALSGGLLITSVAQSADGASVTLLTSAQASYTDYIVTVNNLRDLSPAAHAIAPNSQATFRSWFTGATAGRLRRQVYLGISGNAVTDLTNNSKYPDHHDIEDHLNHFEVPTNFADNHGTRVTALLVPPVTGDYVFYLASDDGGALCLSSDESPANKVLIASEPQWTNSREYTGNAGGRRPGCDQSPPNCENISDPIPLVAGNRYYIEAIVKEGTGGDNLAVAWQMPGGTPPANGSDPIPGAHFVVVRTLSPEQLDIHFTDQPDPVSTLVNRTATFSVAVDSTDSGLSYQWQANSVNIPGAIASTYTTPLLTTGDNGATYRCRVTLGPVTIVSSEAVLTVASDAAGPQPVSAATLTGATGVGLCFDELLDPASAVNKANYTIENAQVTSVTIQPDGRSVNLAVFGLAGSSFSVRISNVNDLAGNPIAPGTLIGIDRLPTRSANIGIDTNWVGPGSAYSCHEGDFTIVTGGGDICCGGDNLRFTYEERLGDFDVKVQVASIDGGAFYARAALMAREDLNPSSRNYKITAFPATGANAYEFSYRPSFAANTDIVPQTAPVSGVSFPNAWLRLKRQGATIFSYYGGDGQHWTELGRHTPDTPLPNRVFVGMATSDSRNTPGQTTTVAYRRFGNFSEQPPVITQAPVDTTVIRFQHTTLSVNATGTTPFAYEWLFNDAPLIEGVDNVTGTRYRTLSLRNVQLNRAGTYSVRLSNGDGTVTSAAAVLTVIDPPAIVTQPANLTVVQGATAAFTVAATGTAPLTYQWLFNGANIPGATAATLTIPDAQPNDIGNYSVVISNTGGQALSSIASLVVITPPTITTHPQSKTANAGATVSFTVAASGSGPFIYGWTHNGVELPGATSATLTLNGVTSSQAGTYVATVANAAGAVPSNPAQLTVIDPPLVVAAPEPQTVLQGSDAIFTVVAAGTEPLAYQWQRNGVNIQGATNPFYIRPNAQAADEGDFRVVISNPAGTITTPAVKLTVLVPPSILTQPKPQTNVVDTTAVFTVVAQGTAPLAYQWRFKGQDIPGANANTLTLAKVQPAQAGDYSVHVSNPVGEVLSLPAPLTVLVPPQIVTEPASQTNVVGGKVTFTVAVVGGAPLSFQWRFNGVNINNATSASLTLENLTLANAGNYSVVISSPGGNVTSANAALVVVTPPAITLHPANRTVLPGATVTFTVFATGSVPLRYQWHFNGAPIDNATSSTLTLINVQLANLGDYTVVVSNAGGSVTSNAGRLTVNVAPSFVQAPQHATNDVGSTATFQVVVTGTPPFGYQWRFNGNLIPNATSDTLVIENVQAANEGLYDVIVNNSVSVISSAPVRLVVNLPPSIVIQPQPQTAVVGDRVTFSVTATGTEPLLYQWKFGGVNISGAISREYVLPSVQFQDAGEYSVEVRNSAGLKLSQAAALTVLAQNKAPEVVITSPANLQAFTAPAAVPFTANASDPDGTIASVEFLRDGISAGIDTTAPYAATLTGLAVGTYTLTAKATDNQGLARTSPAVTLLVRPQNNDFAQRLALNGATPLANGSNLNATKEGGEPDHAGNAGGKSVWWTWAAPASGPATITTAGSGFDTLLAVYTGTALNALTLVATGDDDGALVTSTATFQAQAGTAYQIAVDGWGGGFGQIQLAIDLNAPPTVSLTAPGAGATFLSPASIVLNATAADSDGTIARVEFFNGATLLGADTSIPYSFVWNGVGPGSYSLRARATDSRGAAVTSAAVNVGVNPPRPANDDFLNRILLAGSDAAADGSNVAATQEPGEPRHEEHAGGRSIWWSWRAPATGTAVISTAGSAVDTVLAVYTGFTLASLTQVANDDDSGGQGTSRVNLEATADTVYQIAVDSLVGIAGAIRLEIDLVVPPTVSIVTPVNGASFTAPATIQITGKASDSVGTVTHVDLFQGTTLIATVTDIVNTQYSYTWQNVVAGAYTLTARARNSSGATATSSAVQLTVQGTTVEPVILTQPQSQAVAVGVSTAFSVEVQGSPPLTYQWRFNGVDIAGATSPTLSLANVQAAHAGNYTVVISNDAGFVVSAPAALSVLEPPRITVQSQSQLVGAGANVTLSVTANGTGPLAYQWQRDGTPIPGANGPTLLLNNVQPPDSGAYAVVITNPAGALVSAEVLLTVVALAVSGEPPSQARDDFWITDGPVLAVLPANGMLYLGGDFHYAGPNVGGGAAIDRETGAPDLAWPRVNGEVRAIVPDGAGGWFIGGIFTSVGGLARTNIAHLRADETVDAGWNPSANGPVRALALVGNTLYVGGQFGRIGGQPRVNLAALDAASGEATSWQADADGAVHALLVAGNTLFAGGEFSIVSGRTRKRLAALNTSDGAATAWNPNANDVVFALALSGNTLYAGGQFSNIGGRSRSRLAALDAATGDALAWSADADNSVRALKADGGTLYVGGFFNNIGGVTRNYLAALDAATASVSAWDPNPDNAVYALDVTANTLYAGGQFSMLGGLERPRLAALDRTSALPSAWQPHPNDRVFALALADNALYAGGQFISVGGKVRHHLAALDAASGVATDWAPDPDAPVHALAHADGTVYAGGQFTHVGAAPRGFLAAIDGASGALLDWNPEPNDFVYALGLTGSTLYFGGEFTLVRGQPRLRLAAADPLSGALTPWNPAADAAVFALAATESVVYAGGDFASVGGRTRTRLAALDPGLGQATVWNPIADGRVNALVAAPTAIYAGGFFTRVGGQDRSRLAALDVATGDATAWNPGPTTLNAASGVQALALSGNALYVGGFFTRIGGQTRNNLAAVDVTTANATGWNPSTSAAVSSLAVLGNTGYAGGQFGAVGGQVLPYFAAFAPEGLPIIVSQPARQTVAAGATATFNVSARGQEPLLYQWRVNGANIPGANSADYTIAAVQPSQAGLYSVVVNNAVGSVTSQNASLGVLSPPVITSQPLGQIAAPGATVDFNVIVTGSEPFTFQWRRNGENIDGATAQRYAIADVQPIHAGTYSVAVANQVGSVSSLEVHLQIQVASVTTLADNFADRPLSERPSDAIAASNASASREPREPNHAGKPGGRSLWLQWRAAQNGIATFNTIGSAIDTLLAVYTGDSLGALVPVASDEDQGGFFASLVSFNVAAGVNYVIAVDGFGGAAGNIALNWNFEATAEEVPRIVESPQSQTAPAGSKVTLRVVAESRDALAYRWYFNGLSIPGANASSYVINSLQPLHVGVYTVEVSNGSRAVLSSPAVIEIGPIPEAITEDKLQDLFATTPGGLSPQRSATSGARRRQNIAGVVAGSLGTQILDNFGATKELGEPNHAGSLGGASRCFRLKMEANGVLVIDTLNSDIDTVLAVYTGNNWTNATLIASDDNGAPDGIRSLVRFPVVRDDEYLAVVDGAGGASGDIKLNWRLGTQPGFTQEPASQSARQGGTVTFGANAVCNPAPAYQWRRNGSDIPGATNATLVLNNVQTADAGVYTVLARNFVGSASSKPASLTIVANLPPTLGAINNQTLLEGNLLSIPLSASDPETAANNLKFNLEAGAPAGMTIDAATTTIRWTPTEAQGPSTNIVAVRVTDDGNPAQSDVRNFTVIVQEANRPPTLEPIANQTLEPGSALAVRALASDPDVPANVLTFALVAPPAGMTIEPATGHISWTPSAAQAGAHSISVEVRDNGSPQQRSNTAFTVTVNAPPADLLITAVEIVAGRVTLSWAAQPGKSYQVQIKNRLEDTDWINLGAAHRATGATLSSTDTPAPQIEERYYRIQRVD